MQDMILKFIGFANNTCSYYCKAAIFPACCNDFLSQLKFKLQKIISCICCSRFHLTKVKPGVFQDNKSMMVVKDVCANCLWYL